MQDHSPSTAHILVSRNPILPRKKKSPELSSAWSGHILPKRSTQFLNINHSPSNCRIRAVWLSLPFCIKADWAVINDTFYAAMNLKLCIVSKFCIHSWYSNLLQILHQTFFVPLPLPVKIIPGIRWNKHRINSTDLILSRELAAAQFQRYFHVIREKIVEILHSSIKGIPVRSISYSIFKTPSCAHRSNEVHNKTVPVLDYATYWFSIVSWLVA